MYRVSGLYAALSDCWSDGTGANPQPSLQLKLHNVNQLLQKNGLHVWTEDASVLLSPCGNLGFIGQTEQNDPWIGLGSFGLRMA